MEDDKVNPILPFLTVGWMRSIYRLMPGYLNVWFYVYMNQLCMDTSSVYVCN